MNKFIKDDFKLEDFSHREFKITVAKRYEIRDVLTQEAISFFNGKNLGRPMITVYCSKPGDSTSIHIDGVYVKNQIFGSPSFAINWVVNGECSTISWYVPNIEKSVTVFPKNKRPFSLYNNADDLKLIDTTTITQTALVRIDIPHQVKNFGESVRWAISLRFLYNKLEWTEAVHHFKDVIVI